VEEKLKKPALLILSILCSTLCACANVHFGPYVEDFARQPLPENDGWAAFAGPVTGGSTASAENDVTVSTRKALFDAVAKAGTAPKIIRIRGTINLSTDDTGNELMEQDYAAPEYDFAAYVKTYAPAVWNTRLDEKDRPFKLSGPLEDARKASVHRQRQQVTLKLPSNTTLIGVGTDAKLIRGNVWIGAEAENVIIRNITFEDAFDYFPAWDPNDNFKLSPDYPGCQTAYVDAATGPQQCPGGRWNSEYDNISINGGRRVWIDHCTFTDGERPDTLFPPVFPFPHNDITQKLQHHDGTVDITNAADLVTLSYNVFRDHDKTNLIGNSDNAKFDSGHLRVTFHHNLYEEIGQRMPRVRFGMVHVYNNVYIGDASGADIPTRTPYQNHLAVLQYRGPAHIMRSVLGAGKDSGLYSEANVFLIAHGGNEIAVASAGGDNFFDKGSLVNGQPLDITKANGKPLNASSTWTPTLYGNNTVLPASEVLNTVRAKAGAGKL
jgi:pectate lyase